MGECKILSDFIKWLKSIKCVSIKKMFIVPYLFTLAIASIGCGLFVFSKGIGGQGSVVQTAIYCVLVGIFAGTFYCLRAYYIHACTPDGWQDCWIPWYYIRPVTSGMAGLVSLLFIKAGLLVFATAPEAAKEGSNVLTFYLAFAFIAGYNVHNFMDKLEKISVIEPPKKNTDKTAPKE